MTAMVHPDTRTCLDQLIAFPTISRDSNLGLIEWARDYLHAQGARCRLSFDQDGTKANLFASFGPDQPDGGLVLAGHSDVVPVTGQEWHSDPFIAHWEHDRVYGRGSCDMKGFLAVCMAIVPQITARYELRQPLHLAFTYDEEIGCLGVRTLLQDLQQAGIRPDGCIVGEPTGMNTIIAHKGRQSYRCRVRGKEAHSSLAPHAVNAIEYAAKMIVRLQELAIAEQQFPQAGYDVPFSTLATTQIHGGIASNVIPRDCEFNFEYRYLPGQDPERLIAQIRRYAAHLSQQMQTTAAECGIEVEQTTHALAFAADTEQDFIRFAQTLTGSRPSRVAYATEAGFFQRAGIATVVCGPGDIAQAHRPDEFVSVAQLHRCEQLLWQLGSALSHPTTNHPAAN